MARTQEEIVKKIQDATDFLGFVGEVLQDYLDWDHVQPLLSKDTEITQEKWEAPLGDFAGWGTPTNKMRPVSPDDREFILESMRQYMIFAWDKAEVHRGISAGRSINKFSAWLWLLEDEEGEAFATNSDNYPMYGAPILAWICKKYNFPIPKSESLQRMINGSPCSDDCHGCR